MALEEKHRWIQNHRKKVDQRRSKLQIKYGPIKKWGCIYLRTIMCKNCGNCSAEHGARTIDDAIDETLDSPI
jgi:hypothetical protein